MAIRGLMRSVADASDGDWLEEDSANDVLRDLAETFRTLATGADAFGELVRHEGDVQTSLSRDDIARLQEAQDGMLRARDRLDVALTETRPVDVVELYAATRSTVRRLQHELGLDERVRRQLRLLPPRRLPTPPPSVDDLRATCPTRPAPTTRPRCCHGSLDDPSEDLP